MVCSQLWELKTCLFYINTATRWRLITFPPWSFPSSVISASWMWTAKSSYCSFTYIIVPYTRVVLSDVLYCVTVWQGTRRLMNDTRCSRETQWTQDEARCSVPELSTQPKPNKNAKSLQIQVTNKSIECTADLCLDVNEESLDGHWLVVTRTLIRTQHYISVI